MPPAIFGRSKNPLGLRSEKEYKIPLEAEKKYSNCSGLELNIASSCQILIRPHQKKTGGVSFIRSQRTPFMSCALHSCQRWIGIIALTTTTFKDNMQSGEHNAKLAFFEGKTKVSSQLRWNNQTGTVAKEPSKCFCHFCK